MHRATAQGRQKWVGFSRKIHGARSWASCRPPSLSLLRRIQRLTTSLAQLLRSFRIPPKPGEGVVRSADRLQACATGDLEIPARRAAKDWPASSVKRPPRSDREEGTEEASWSSLEEAGRMSSFVRAMVGPAPPDRGLLQMKGSRQRDRLGRFQAEETGASRASTS
jgi:hypothetical protein